ncbi:MAG: DUF1254 domain-containing protein [Arachidicoccus sp.]|nr:DUF1254 domain-containing protein [Arachidicoccus sp.]
MNPLKKVLTIAGCGILLHANAQQEVKIHLPKDSVLAIARDAYIYAAPLVYTDATRLKLSSADNVFFHQRFFPDYTFRAVVAPNNDTNYSIAFLDLSSDPVIIETPDTKGRYFVIPFLDAWTNNFELIGKRTTGTKAQNLFVSGPNWKGKVPEGFRHIKSPTNLVWVIGRIQVNNKEDQKSVVSPLQDKIRLTTLAKWLVKDTSALPHVQKQYYSITKDQFKNGVAQGIKALPIEEFFNYTNALLEDNPPAAYDEKIVKANSAD